MQVMAWGMRAWMRTGEVNHFMKTIGRRKNLKVDECLVRRPITLRVTLMRTRKVGAVVGAAITNM